MLAADIMNMSIWIHVTYLESECAEQGRFTLVTIRAGDRIGIQRYVFSRLRLRSSTPGCGGVGQFIVQAEAFTTAARLLGGGWSGNQFE